ncbi:MAG: VanZ family protein [Lachnospiraceae bacterium]|nr:VanZ family protein [Lachnospiraceae bacterium]
MRKYWKVVCIAFSISLSIELIQLAMHLGLFELDDLFHNSLGCALGYGIFVGIAGIGKKNQQPIEEKWIAALFWIVVIAFLVFAIAMGQPVFGFLFR